MRKSVLLLLTLLLLVSCQEKKEELCVLDGTQVCYVEDSDQIAIEEGATIRIAGIETAVETAIIDLWNTTYPQYAGLITPNNEELVYTGTSDFLSTEPTFDIVYTSEEIATYYMDKLRAMEASISHEILMNSTMETVMGDIWKYFLPYSSEGVTFLYNKTMLDEFGVDTETDEDGNGLPDSFDTWEEIFALADSWEQERPVYKDKEVLITFPFAFNEMSMSYFMLTSGFRLFPDNVGSEIGFNRDSFVNSLEFISEIGKHPMASKRIETKNGKEKVVSYEPYRGEDYVWQWEKVLTNEISPFGLIASWMSIEEAVNHTGAEYIVTPFPTYKENQQVSLISYKGFVIKANTPYPSAANAVMQFLRSEEAMQLFVEYSSELPYLYSDHELEYTDVQKEQWAKALQQGDHIPLLALPDNVYTSAMNGYYEIEWQDVLVHLVNQESTPEQAAKTMESRFEEWYKSKSKIYELEEELQKIDIEN